ncbi:hypothetical protein Scep_021252 [Stephania cephalantha]|uniref:Uncharacterized protein n=1 Tax=Stephania cephalantha TaxID=152367 RepID=A0AAP0FAG3_9MAGN
MLLLSLHPHWVVFFGDNVPKDRANRAREATRECDALLVLGSFLMTMFAFRLVRYYLGYSTFGSLTMPTLR